MTNTESVSSTVATEATTTVEAAPMNSNGEAVVTHSTTTAAGRAAAALEKLGLDRSAPFSMRDVLGETRGATDDRARIAPDASTAPPVKKTSVEASDGQGEPSGPVRLEWDASEVESDPAETGELAFPTEAPREDGQGEATSAADRYELRRQARKVQERDRQLSEQSKALREQQQAFQQQQQQYQQMLQAAQQIDSDPDALLRAAGITDQDKIQAYRRTVMNKIIADHAPPDPLQQKVNEALQPELQRLQAQQQQIQELHQTYQKNAIMTSQVLPVFAQPEQYESLVRFCNGNVQQAAETVFNAVAQHFAATNQMMSFAEAAKQLDDNYAGELDMGINQLKSMKRYAHLFHSETDGTSKTNSVTTTAKSGEPVKAAPQAKPKKPAPTLTNQTSSFPNQQPKSNVQLSMDRKERAMRELGLDANGRRLPGSVRFEK